MSDSTAALLAFLIVIPVALLVGGIIQAVFIRAAGKWVCGLEISFGRALGTALVVIISGVVAGAMIGFGVGFVAAASGAGRDAGRMGVPFAQVLSFIANFFIAAAIMAGMIRVSFPRAMLMQLVVLGLGIALILCVAIVLVPVLVLLR